MNLVSIILFSLDRGWRIIQFSVSNYFKFSFFFFFFFLIKKNKKNVGIESMRRFPGEKNPGSTSTHN